MTTAISTQTHMNSSPPAVATGFVPSRYQQAIFDWVVNGSGHGFVNACAGSGKTTTLVQCASLIQGTGTFLAFSKEIAKELKSRLVGTPMQASTIHSLGYGMLNREVGKVELTTSKFRSRVKEVVYNSDDVDPEDTKQAIDTLTRMLDLVRLNLVDPHDEDAVFELAMHHSFELYGDLLNAIPLLLKWGENLALQRRLIDFTDMIYLPVKAGLSPQQTDFVFVDEAQDLNACQLEIALKAVKPDGRLLFVGDVNQAIFGFSGADANSYQKIIERTQPTELPLNICYRCPTSHIKLAKRIVSEIEPSPSASDGVVKHISNAEFADHIGIGDLVLSRKTAPLVARCIKLIQNRIPAQVKGRDIGESLVSVLKQIAKDEGYGFAYTRLQEHLAAYEDKHVRALTKRGADEMQIGALRDKVKTLLTCYLYWGATDINDLHSKIRSMFGEDQKGKTALNPKVVNFCTIHRAKGLEAARVFIIDPKSLPLTWKDQQRWQFQQEMNLKYVALTRGKSALYIVGDDPEAPSIPVKGQMEPPAHWYDQVKPKPDKQAEEGVSFTSLIPEEFDVEQTDPHVFKLARKKPVDRWTISDWQALANIDTAWGAEAFEPAGDFNPVLPGDQIRIMPDTDWPGSGVSNDLVIQWPDAPTLKAEIKKLDQKLGAIDKKVMRARWRRESEAQNVRFQNFCRHGGRIYDN